MRFQVLVAGFLTMTASGVVAAPVLKVSDHDMTSNQRLVLTSCQLGETQDMDKTIFIKPKQGVQPHTEIMIEPIKPVIAGRRFRRGGGSVGGTGSGAGGGGSAGGGTGGGAGMWEYLSCVCIDRVADASHNSWWNGWIFGWRRQVHILNSLMLID
jgi:uncharacterized membrane protein YgcG